MLTDDEIRSKLRVAFNEAGSDHARSEAAAGLVAHALIALGRIAIALERRTSANVSVLHVGGRAPNAPSET